jgi:hypothetical protein
MDYRCVLLIGAVFGAGALAASTACNGPDPGAITFAERPSTGGGEPQSGTSGTTGTADAGTGPGGPDAGDIFGNTTFTYVAPAMNANNANTAHAGTVEGKDCMVAGCHLDGTKVWVFSGTLYSTPQGGATVAKGEVKVVGPDGAEIGSAYTDANGNFWLEKAGATIPQGSRVGVRKEGGTKPMMMQTALQPGDSGCSKAGTCHGGSTGKVYAN